MIDALAYIDQLAKIGYFDADDDWDELNTSEPLDLYAGY